VLAKAAHKALKTIAPEDQDLSEDLSHILKTADEFEAIDADSYSYRYPINNRGEPSTPHHQVVNIHGLASRMDSILQYLPPSTSSSK